MWMTIPYKAYGIRGNALCEKVVKFYQAPSQVAWFYQITTVRSQNTEGVSIV